jgi:MtrB/PioB family decaheme-associated outer membrane protein
MRILATAGVFLFHAALAAAQATPPSRPPRAPDQAADTAAPAQGWVDTGVRVSGIDGDGARYERYRDLGDGLFLAGARHAGERNGWFFSAGADHVGRRDQRYFAAVERPGRFELRFEWDQIPLLMSRDTRTPFLGIGSGVLGIDDDIQRQIQSGGATLALAAANAVPFTARYRRHSARLLGRFMPREDTDIRFGFSTALKEGNMPWGGPFGFNLAVEVPAPIDHRTTNLATSVEWTNGNAMAGAAYDGSWFANDIQTLIWDNPVKLTDSTFPTAYIAGTGTSRGRMALWPDSTYHVVSARGFIRLPGRSRASAFLSIGNMRQDEPLLPHTINTAIESPDLLLPRTSADAEARTTGLNLSFTTRPWTRVALDARYRLSDFDNQTEHFAVPAYVRIDQVIEPGIENEPYSVQRQYADVEATFMPASWPTMRVGYRRETGDRTFRIFETTTENALRLSVDAIGHQRFTVRALYELSSRSGEGFDLHPLEAVGEQPGMRHFDVAERDRQRVTVQATAMATGRVGLNGSIAVGNDDYDDGQFGLRDNDHRVYTIGLTATPTPQSTIDVSYGLEQYDAFFTSRQAATPDEFVNPARDWGTDSDDTVHTLTASLDVLRLVENVDLRVGYDFSRSEATYLYETGVVTDRTLPEGSPLPSDLPPPQQLPPVEIDQHRATADAKYWFSPRIALGLAYWFDKYDVEDFALANPLISQLDLPGGLLIGYRYRPYTAHTGWVRVIYRW